MNLPGMDAESLYDDLHREFETWKSKKLLSWYARTILQSRQNLIRKMSQIASLIKHKIRIASIRMNQKSVQNTTAHCFTMMMSEQ